MPDVIADVTLVAGGVHHPPGSRVPIEDPDEADVHVARGDAHWPEPTEAESESDVCTKDVTDEELAEVMGEPSTWTVEQLRAELQDRVDLDAIEGSGANGNVVKADLVRALESLDAPDEDGGGGEDDEEGEDDPDAESED